ncbi:hypothetical protein C8J56DRAFT_1009167 [Mycena floridula]|nr:hypothetical protein C8J56DRAFT_1009167 [Mycena floridula]
MESINEYPELSQGEIVAGFRQKYHGFVTLLADIMVNDTDSFRLVRAGDDLDEFLTILDEHGHFLEALEAQQLRNNIISMQHDVRLRYHEVVEDGIAHYLGLSRTLVRDQLLEHGITTPGSDPFPEPEEDESDELLDPLLPQQPLPSDIPRCNGPHTPISDDSLDNIIRGLQGHFRRAGVRMLDGYLRTLGRRGYTVPGPNSLWHHDGQHGSSVHNVRIERLWVDVTNQIGATWAELLMHLKLSHGLDINNENHIWLVHCLFLDTINNQFAFFADSWNNHSIQIRCGASQSPIALFGFDMLALGIRGHELQLSDDELEVYGLDWDALQDTSLLHAQASNNPETEELTSWLNEVIVDAPETIVLDADVAGLDAAVEPFIGQPDNASVVSAWLAGLTYCRNVYGNEF